MRESTGEDPTIPIPELLVQPGNMLKESHANSFTSHGLQHPRRETILITKRLKVRDEHFLGVFDLDEDRQEDFLVVPVPRKEHDR